MLPLERNLLEQGFWYFAWSRTREIQVFPRNPSKNAKYREIRQKYFQIHFPWNRPLFLRICPWESFEIGLFSAKIPGNWPIFLRILTFFLRKSHKFAPENPAKFCFFFCEISEALLEVLMLCLHRIFQLYIPLL